MARESKFTKNDLFTSSKELLLKHGYAGFHFGLLAEKLDITRGAIYKYFDNKDELITAYMEYEMEQFMRDLVTMKKYQSFDEQLDCLLNVIFKYSEIHQLLSMIYQIPKTNHKRVNEKMELLEGQHQHMYTILNNFIDLGRREGRLKSQFPNHLILGFIFQSVNIPNLSQLPKDNWHELVLDFLCHGMSK